MTPSQYRAGGTDEEIRFAVGQTSLGAILVASSRKGVAAILLGEILTDWSAVSGPLSESASRWRGSGVRGVDCAGCRLHRDAANRPDSSY